MKPIIDIKVELDQPPFGQVLTATSGSYHQEEGGIMHVSVAPPFVPAQPTLSRYKIYRIRADGGDVDLRPLAFVDFSSQTGAARFASQA
jgi:hypothetical protein